MRWAIILLLVISGCATTKPIEGYTEIRGYDFTKYSELGFLFTPGVYTEPYESVGMIRVILWPRLFRAASNAKMKNFRRIHGSDGSDWYIEELKTSKAIESMYQQASKMGANALTRFDVEVLTKKHGTVILPGIEISGFAIKRLNTENLTSN